MGIGDGVGLNSGCTGCHIASVWDGRSKNHNSGGGIGASWGRFNSMTISRTVDHSMRNVCWFHANTNSIISWVKGIQGCSVSKVNKLQENKENIS